MFIWQPARPELIGNQSLTKLPTANVFPTEDGYIQLSAISDPSDELCAAMGLGVEKTQDSRHETQAKNRDAMRAILIETLKTATTEQWLNRLMMPESRPLLYRPWRKLWRMNICYIAD